MLTITITISKKKNIDETNTSMIQGHAVPLSIIKDKDKYNKKAGKKRYNATGYTEPALDPNKTGYFKNYLSEDK